MSELRAIYDEFTAIVEAQEALAQRASRLGKHIQTSSATHGASTVAGAVVNDILVAAERTRSYLRFLETFVQLAESEASAS